MSRHQVVSSTKLYSIRKLGSHDNQFHTATVGYAVIGYAVIEQTSPSIELASGSTDSISVEATESISPKMIWY